MNRKFWQFKNEGGSSAELLLYGPISEYSWWGDEVTPKQFAEDLQELGRIDELTVRINSGGGDVFAAHAMCSMLRANSAKIIVVIDGLAASAATIVAMSGDDIQIPPNAMMMIHNPMLGLLGMYNKNELNEMGQILDKVKDSIVESYKLKTSIDEAEIVQMMDDTTWMTGREAVEKGFADTLLEDSVVNTVLSGKMVLMNDVSFDLSRFKNIPEALREKQAPPQVDNQVPAKPEAPKKPAQNTKNEEETPMTAEQLKNENPDLYKEIYDLGVSNERARIKNLDEIRDTRNEKIVKDAMFDSGLTAEACALKILNANKKAGEIDLKNRIEDAEKSNADLVASTPEALETKDEEELAVKNMVAGARR